MFSFYSNDARVREALGFIFRGLSLVIDSSAALA
jgi:hypothetical protein